MFSIRIIITEINFSIKSRILWLSFDFNKDQPSNRIDSVTMNFYFRRKTRFHFSHSPLIGRLFIIILHLIRIRSSKNFNSFNIVRINHNVHIRSWWEESKIKCLKHIFFDISLIHCTEIVKSFDVFEHFTSFGLETSWNTNDRGMNVHVFCSILDYWSLLRQSFITNISEHDNPVFCLWCPIFIHPLLQNSLRFLKSLNNCGSSSSSDTIQLLENFWIDIFLQGTFKENCSTVIEQYHS